jgi:hypothetical protein
MDFDTVSFLENLFGTAGPMAPIADGSRVGDDGAAGSLSAAMLSDVEADAELLTPFAGWVQRPDCHGRMGWEAPNLPEWQRWWARCDFDDLPAPSDGLCLDDMAKPALEDCARCVSGGPVDTLDLSQRRPVQRHLRGFGGA